MDYSAFLKRKEKLNIPCGLIDIGNVNDALFPFQRDIVKWALRRGRAAVFADCGMGKTPMQLEWARHIDGDVLILAPLAVATQTVREGVKFGVNVNYCRAMDGVKPGINITNYEMLPHFDAEHFAGVVLDESSILKNYTGKIRNQIIDAFKQTPYRLACTATPAPNDYMELGNHSEFLGVMTRSEMLSMFFVHDGGETQKWRIKGHAEEPFWKWICSWAVNIRKPSDLGYDNGDFVLPEMEWNHHIVKKNAPPDGFLFPVEALTLQERQRERKATIQERANKCASLANATDRPFLVWCNLNDESAECKRLIHGAVEVKGSDSPEHKEKAMLGFASGDIRVLVTKPSIAGFGMNWQHCSDMAFVGLSDSYEQLYQAVRRCWRFGQKNTVNVHVVTADTEGAVVRNIQRKESESEAMTDAMVKYMCDINSEEIRGTMRDVTIYEAPERMLTPTWLKG